MFKACQELGVCVGRKGEPGVGRGGGLSQAQSALGREQGWFGAWQVYPILSQDLRFL